MLSVYDSRAILSILKMGKSSLFSDRYLYELHPMKRSISRVNVEDKLSLYKYMSCVLGH